MDENGQSTGMEKKSFKLNVLDGSTESIDDEWDRVRRENGLEDGTNRRRVMGGGLEQEWQDLVDSTDEQSELSDGRQTDYDGYQADVSDRSTGPDISTVDDLGRRRTTLSSPQCGENHNALGRRRTTLSSPQCGENDTDALGRIRTTLRNLECSVECEGQRTESEVQGLWEVCEALQGGGTWEALLDSNNESSDDFSNIALLGDGLDASSSMQSDGGVGEENEVVDIRIHSDDPSGPSE